MNETQSEPPLLRRLLDAISALLRADWPALVGQLLPLLGRWFNRAEGIYEVLDFEAQLELCDPQGEAAIYSKRERVQFLQDNVIAYQDQAWGDGDIFAEYKCSPGVPVDRYQEGYRYRILISLRQTKNRGDIEEFRIERHIRHGFTKPEGSFQTNVDHRTQKLALHVVFPSERKPLDVLLVEQHGERTIPLGTAQIHHLPNEKWLVEWQVERPRQFESYIVRWKW
jgi:hypothetical protein